MRIKNGISSNNGITNKNGITSNNGITAGVPLIGGVEVACPSLILCNPLTMQVLPGGDFGNGLFTLSPTNTLTFAYNGGGAPGGGFYTSVETFELGNNNKLWAEITVDSFIGTPSDFYFVTLGITDNLGGLLEGYAIAIGEGGISPTGDILAMSEIFANFPTFQNYIFEDINILDSLPYTTQMRVDGAIGQIEFTDGIRTAVVGSFDPNIAAAGIKLQIGIIGFNANPATITATLNGGYASAFHDPNINYVTKDTYTPPEENIFDCDPGFVSHCNIPAAPPSELPEFFPISEVFANPDLDVVQDGETFTLTNTNASGDPQTYVIQSEWHFCLEAGETAIAEFKLNSITPIDPALTISFGLGQGALGGIEGVTMQPQSFNGTDGVVATSLPPQIGLVGSGIDIGYTIQLRLDSNGQMTYVDSLGTVTNGGVIGSAFQDQPVLFTVVVQTPAFTLPGETQSVVDFTLITNPANATLPVPAGAINLSEVTECYQAYRIFDFASLGDVTPRRDNPQENPPFVGNYGRSIIMRKNPNDPAPVNPEDADIVPPEFTGSIGSGALTFVKNYNNNLVELECTQKSNDGMADQIVRLAGNPFLAVQTEICHNANGTTGVDGIDGTDNAWAIRTFDGFNSQRCIVPLFNGIEYDVGDTISMGIQTAGEAGGNVALQFAVNLGGQSIVYDPIHSDDEGLNGLTWTPILEMITSDNILIGVDDTAEYKVNARQDHYKDVNIYPNEVFTNWVEGTPVTTTLPSLSANLAPFTWKDVVASTAVVAPSINGDVLTINAVGATTKAFAHCPRVVGITYFTGALTYLAEIEITSLTTTQTTEYVFEARSPNTGLPNGVGSNDAARFGIVKNGNELYLKTVTWQGFVLTDYTRLTYTGTGGVAGLQMFGGTGHQIGDQLTMTGGSGTGLVLEVTSAFGGQINSVSIFNAGTGYREYDEDSLSILSSTGIGTGFDNISNLSILDDGNYQYSAGDRLSLMIGTDKQDGSPSGRRTFIAGLVKRAGQAPGEVDFGITGSFIFGGGTEFEDYLLFMGHDAVPATESVVITSKFKAADMHPDIKTQALAIAANFPAPVPQLFDLEGVAIT